MNPVIQPHRYEPTVFVHSAKSEQLSVFKLHSSTSDKRKHIQDTSVHWIVKRLSLTTVISLAAKCQSQETTYNTLILLSDSFLLTHFVPSPYEIFFGCFVAPTRYYLYLHLKKLSKRPSSIKATCQFSVAVET